MTLTWIHKKSLRGRSKCRVLHFPVGRGWCRYSQIFRQRGELNCRPPTELTKSNSLCPFHRALSVITAVISVSNTKSLRTVWQLEIMRGFDQKPPVAYQDVELEKESNQRTECETSCFNFTGISLSCETGKPTWIIWYNTNSWNYKGCLIRSRPLDGLSFHADAAQLFDWGKQKSK